jgi:hypothetical protein
LDVAEELLVGSYLTTAPKEMIFKGINDYNFE